MCVPGRRGVSWASPMGFPDDVVRDEGFVEAGSLSFCLNNVSSSSGPE